MLLARTREPTRDTYPVAPKPNEGLGAPTRARAKLSVTLQATASDRVCTWNRVDLHADASGERRFATRGRDSAFFLWYAGSCRSLRRNS
jgi:hypothetical protein